MRGWRGRGGGEAVVKGSGGKSRGVLGSGRQKECGRRGGGVCRAGRLMEGWWDLLIFRRSVNGRYTDDTEFHE